MMMKVLLLPLLFLLTSVTGSQKPEDIYVKSGEMVALQCPLPIVSNHSDTKLVWTRYNFQDTTVISDMSLAKQAQMSVLLYGRSLVLFNSSVNHQGNYSCSLRNASRQSWFRLTVYTPPSTEIKDRTTFPIVCYTQESCTLTCPDVYIPDVKSLNISSCLDIMWRKEGESLRNKGYFSSVEREDQGIYTCTRSCLYHGQRHNMTFTVNLDVQPNVPKKPKAITSPNNNDVFEVDLGSTVVIDCEAFASSNWPNVFWLSGSSFVKNNNSLPVFYNYTQENAEKQIKMTASLVFKKVSEEDLSRRYTCKLETSESWSSVTISLAKKPRPSYVSLVLVIFCIVAVMSVTVGVYVTFKTDITLFLRDTLGCHRSPSDGKSYDAFLLCYKSETDAGLKDSDRKWLESVLETSYSYSLCLCERDVSPGEAEAEAVLDCIEKSRAVVLVPTSSDSDPGPGLLSAIHAALVERQSQLIFIKTETTDIAAPHTLPEALQQLGKAGDYVTWRGISSMTTSSSFLKQLRYFLPAPRHPPKLRALPQTMQDVTMW